jgi:hypothetical protein
MNRNETFENKVSTWLNRADIKGMSLEEQGMIFSGLIKLYQATDEKAYATYVLNALNEMTDEEGTISGMDAQDSNILNYFSGNALFFALAQTQDEKYKKAIMKLADQLKNQPRNAEGIFAESNADSNKVSMKDALYSQVFYMNYESGFGGKEHYNDIIAQYNSIRSSIYDVNADSMEMAMYSCALIDTMEVMEQPLYEIYRRLQDLLKEAVTAMSSKSVKETGNSKMTATTADLLGAYAVLKACRMKALLTEKYEGQALAVLEAADMEVADGNVLYTGALLLAYGESLRNRQYQDYGRSKGGTLWS